MLGNCAFKRTILLKNIFLRFEETIPQCIPQHVCAYQQELVSMAGQLTCEF